MWKTQRIWWCRVLATALCCAAIGVRAQSVDEAIFLYQKGDYAAALPGLQIGAEKGIAAAQFNLAMMYANGRGVPPNGRLAVFWFKKAAEHDVPEAQFNLGLLYDYGEKVTNDDRLAVFWYRRAAEQGLASAQSQLGKMYSSGRGVVKNEREAFRWRSAAAEQGDLSAQAAVGAMYALGVGVPKDEQLGYFWLLLASAEGDGNSGKLLSILQDRITIQQRVDAHAAARFWKPTSPLTTAPTPTAR